MLAFLLIAFGKGQLTCKALYTGSIPVCASHQGPDQGRLSSRLCIECIEEGGTESTIPLLCRLVAALNADVRLLRGADVVQGDRS
jgi:hypothetical protein